MGDENKSLLKGLERIKDILVNNKVTDERLDRIIEMINKISRELPPGYEYHKNLASIATWNVYAHDGTLIDKITTMSGVDDAMSVVEEINNKIGDHWHRISINQDPIQIVNLKK